ncbi:TonB family protein [Shewanella halifaxensis HAW-EB4]|uniref:TonB family protein n=1 Tax=Shewanella halifaxensis (strain HAW-EB4) TaxID=458817 RepID=B0TKX4_SHEHH|nr:energy transducer TonB [Shewanella halifaxensis]ABZ77176.1 TonB family protein [Shewanella halifaxensis HAW-EB4]
MKVIGLAAFALLLVPQMSQAKNVYGEVLLTEVEPSTQKVWHREGNKPHPYPIEFAQAKLQGCAVLSFDISEEGHTENVEVISSVPNRHLGKNSRKEVKRWRWQPLDTELQATAEKRVLRIDYCLSDVSEEQSLAQCQRQAQLNCG